ncbi:DUF397 domain-containing protein [Streptomyces sp. CBMA29]|uniref:DUF397 domain-containing protein n=1 Tax=Streptomyces sp. CBMA29 TaxID=1896314 RepID=UPI00166191F9|nr:DUF397 domain-containing protein [Streptomyces sp. CBMA29]MBD0740019.1 DUF397 domain-containing protein [Streptomyces sp. CBMA29]
MSAQSGYVSSSASISGVSWRRSSHSTAANNCVETARLVSGLLAVRDSKDQEGPALLFPPGAWSHFVGALRRDDLGPA